MNKYFEKATTISWTFEARDIRSSTPAWPIL